MLWATLAKDSQCLCKYMHGIGETQFIILQNENRSSKKRWLWKQHQRLQIMIAECDWNESAFNLIGNLLSLEPLHPR